jgi:shikimate dehydrogenase
MSLTGRARLAGVIGSPISHSLSPALHGYWIKQHALDAAYVPLPIAPQDFQRVFPLIGKFGFQGANVTLPFKEEAFRLVDERDAGAEATGAVNTVVVDNGRLLGRNTDVFGFAASLAESGFVTLAEKHAVVLGAGGASRAVVFALLSLGAAKVSLVNRTHEKALTLARFFGSRVEACDWGALRELTCQCGILVNTTSLGMAGQPELPVDLDAVSGDALVADIVYRPLETRLLRDARARGLVIADGLDMLMHQARPGFAAWFGVEPQVTPALRTHLVSLLQGH